MTRFSQVFPTIIALGLAMAAPAWAEGPVSDPAPSMALPAISVSPVSKGVLRDRVVASGLVTPVERVFVQPLIEGQPIEELRAEVGDRVEAGQVLARLSSSTLKLQQSQLNASLAAAKATVAQAEAQLLEARSTSDEATRVNLRTAQLRSQGSASQAAADTAAANATSAAAGVTVAMQSLAAAQAQVELVQAQIEDLALQLSRTDVVAPVSGTVVERNALVGAIGTAQGDPMFVIIKDGELELRADVAERFVLKLAPGQQATLRSPGVATPLAGEVRLVDPAVDVASRLGKVRISIDQPELVRTGMFMEADILTAEHDALYVPVTAVGATPGGATVMLVKDGVVSRMPVELGIRDGGSVEIVSGLSEGDLIVTKAASFVRDGDRINPVVGVPATN